MTTTPTTTSDRLLLRLLHTATDPHNIAVPLERTATELGLAPRTISRSLQRLESAGHLTITAGARGRGHITHVELTTPGALGDHDPYPASTRAPRRDSNGHLDLAEQRRVANALLYQAADVGLDPCAISVLSGIFTQATPDVDFTFTYRPLLTIRYFGITARDHSTALGGLVDLGFVELSQPQPDEDGVRLRLRLPSGYEQLGRDDAGLPTTEDQLGGGRDV